MRLPFSYATNLTVLSFPSILAPLFPHYPAKYSCHKLVVCIRCSAVGTVALTQAVHGDQLRVTDETSAKTQIKYEKRIPVSVGAKIKAATMNRLALIIYFLTCSSLSSLYSHLSPSLLECFYIGSINNPPLYKKRYLASPNISKILL